MANISLLSRLVNGVQRQVDLSANTLVVGALTTGTNTLTDAILGRLISLQNASDVDASYHTHNTLYFTKTEIGSTTALSAGSTLIGDDNSYSNFTPTAATVKGALSGIDTALAGVSGSAITALTGDVTAAGPGSAAATVAKIQGTTVSGVTGSGNVVFSASPTLTGTIAGASQTLSGTLVATGAISGSNLTAGGHASLDVPLTAVGAANGVASLDSGGKVPLAQLPSTLLIYLGAWDASTNTPTIADGTGTNGDVYRTSVAGTQDLGSGPLTFAIGDFAIYNGTIWQHSPAADGVSSVNSQTGAVTVNAINQLTGDVTAGPASGSASAASLIASIQGTAVAGVTGTANVVFSDSPTFTGTVVAAAIAASGSVTGSNLSGTNTGDQTIVLTGDVTGSGTGSFATTIANNAITAAKIATSAVDGVSITGGNGIPLSAASTPMSESIQKGFICYDALATGHKTYVMRFSINSLSESGNGIYKADNDATTTDKFWVVGLVAPASAVSTPTVLSMFSYGLYTLASGDTNFSSGDIGKPVYLGAAGTFTVTAPTAANTAAVKIGIVVDTNLMYVSPQVMGIN